MADRVRCLDTDSIDVGSAALHGRLAAVTYAPPGDKLKTEIRVWNTRRNSFKAVAHTDFPAGFLDNLAFDGRYVVFRDTAKEAWTGESLVWTVRWVDTRTGRGGILDRSAPRGDAGLPMVTHGDGRFIWVTWENKTKPLQGRRVLQWRPGDPEATILHRGIWVNDRATAVPGGLVFNRTEDITKRYPSGHGRTDVYLWRDGEPEATNLSNSGIVIYEEVIDGAVLWSELPPARRKTVGPGDAHSIHMVALAPGAQPKRLVNGFNYDNPTGGPGWVAWWTWGMRTGLIDTTTGIRGRVVAKRPYVPVRPIASGNHLLLGENYNKDKVRLCLYRVSTAD